MSRFISLDRFAFLLYFPCFSRRPAGGSSIFPAAWHKSLIEPVDIPVDLLPAVDVLVDDLALDIFLRNQLGPQAVAGNLGRAAVCLNHRLEMTKNQLQGRRGGRTRIL